MKNIQIKRSTVAGKAPKPTDIEVGELAVNLADKKLFSKDASNAIVELGGAVPADLVTSSTSGKEHRISEIVSITQADYDAMGTGRPADKLFIING